VLASVAPVVGPDGAVQEYVHSLRDITRLKQADEAKSIFLATATHELKTPLTVISGFLDTIDRPEMDEDARRDAVTIMRRRAKELSDIIERMLLASRIDSGKVEVFLAPTDLATVLTDRVGALRSATGRDITLHFAGDTPAPDARADDGALAIVVDHLLDNALKYSNGAIEVTVSAGEQTVSVAIADAGIGMDQTEIAHCFDKFWQADSGDARRSQGTGIGLYIVRSLIEAMGGAITVRSTPGMGTTFNVELDRADREPVIVAVDEVTAPVVEPSIVREFMRQIGIPSRRPPT
jgi:signal transduction histidine kinase